MENTIHDFPTVSTKYFPLEPMPEMSQIQEDYGEQDLRISILNESNTI